METQEQKYGNPGEFGDYYELTWGEWEDLIDEQGSCFREWYKDTEDFDTFEAYKGYLMSQLTPTSEGE